DNTSGADEVCPKVETPQENNCRIDENGITLRLLNEPENDDSCRVDINTYECSEQHLADLELAGRQIEKIECETREARAEAERVRLETVWQEAFDNCMSGQSSSTGQASQRAAENRCRSQADRAREIAETKTIQQLELEEMEQYSQNQEERQRQLQVLTEKMDNVAEMLGLVTLKAFEEQQSNVDLLEVYERVLEANRKHARERLLRLIQVIHQDFDHSIIIEEQEVSNRWFELQARFAKLGAQATNNLMAGVNNDETKVELFQLMEDFDALTGEYPSLALVAFNEAVTNVLRSIN
ncbi:MAG: hypothetical protein MJK18_07350, partial [Bdellovibrionales bacterium]|nr:hypothetical protein [Bdellovibrionales bacterium]